MKKQEAADQLPHRSLTEICNHPVNLRAMKAYMLIGAGCVDEVRKLLPLPDYWCERVPRSRTRYHRRNLLAEAYPFDEISFTKKTNPETGAQSGLIGPNNDFSKAKLLLPMFCLLLDAGLECDSNNWRGHLSSHIIDAAISKGDVEEWRMDYAIELVKRRYRDSGDAFLTSGYGWISPSGMDRVDRLREAAGVGPIPANKWLSMFLVYADCHFPDERKLYDTFEKILSKGARMSPEEVCARMQSMAPDDSSSHRSASMLLKLDSFNDVRWNEVKNIGDPKFHEWVVNQGANGNLNEQIRRAHFERCKWPAEKVIREMRR